MPEPRKWNQIVREELRKRMSPDVFACNCGIGTDRMLRLLDGKEAPYLWELERMAEALRWQLFELFLDPLDGWHLGRLHHLHNDISGAGVFRPRPPAYVDATAAPMVPAGGLQTPSLAPPPGRPDDHALALILSIAHVAGPLPAAEALLNWYRYERQAAPCSNATSSPPASSPSASAPSSSGGPGASGSGSTTTASG